MKILIDKKIPYLIFYGKFFFKKFSVIPFNDLSKIFQENQEEVYAVFVSSNSKVGFGSLWQKEQIKASPLTFIGSPTSGLDHIAEELQKSKKVTISSTPGINSQAVVEYVFAVILKYVFEKGLILEKMKLGIVGFGAIGSKLHDLVKKFKIETIIYDPYVAGYQQKKNLNAMKKCGIISFHVPLTITGKHKTHHMVNENYYKRILSPLEKGIANSKKLIINTSRGEIFDSLILKDKIRKKFFLYAFDVWPNEPDIDVFFIDRAWLATPHIAGYSAKNKREASERIFLNFLNFLQKKKIENNKAFPKKFSSFSVNRKDIFLPNRLFLVKNQDENEKEYRVLVFIMEKILQLETTNRYFKKKENQSKVKDVYFTLRKKYLKKKEFSEVNVFSNHSLSRSLKKKLKLLNIEIVSSINKVETKKA